MSRITSVAMMAFKWMLLLAILSVFTGCKPQQIITEKVVTKVDSTAVNLLQSELKEKTIEVNNLKTDLERLREENIELRSEVSRHEINYDTEAPLKPDGSYPIRSEVRTISKTEYDQTIRDHEKATNELKAEIQREVEKNINLEQQVKTLTDENRDLKQKITPTTGFNFRLFGWGIIVGMILLVAGYFVIKIKLL